jgi:hypothetical protein
MTRTRPTDVVSAHHACTLHHHPDRSRQQRLVSGRRSRLYYHLGPRSSEWHVIRYYYYVYVILLTPEVVSLRICMHVSMGRVRATTTVILCFHLLPSVPGWRTRRQRHARHPDRPRRLISPQTTVQAHPFPYPTTRQSWPRRRPPLSVTHGSTPNRLGHSWMIDT